MIRTKWKNDLQRARCYRDANLARLNKSPCLYSPLKLNSYIRQIIPTIDRIQFTVINQGQTFRDVLSMFKKVFRSRGRYQDKNDNCQIWKFSIGSCPVELKRYNFKHFNFSISLHDPDESSQSIIRDMLFNLPISYVTISEVEFAWDFYPELLSDLVLLFHNINQRLNLSYSRPDSSATCSGNGTFTKYQGKKGNIHKGTKGRRVYLRPYCPDPIGHPDYYKVIPECVRAEVQVNRKTCKKLHLELTSLPIAPDMDFFKYLEFRENMTEQWLTKLTVAVFKKRYGKSQFLKRLRERDKASTRKYKSTAGRVIKSGIRDDITRRVLLPVPSKPGKPPYFWLGEQESVPVSEQIDRFKHLAIDEGLTYKANQVFPKIKHGPAK